MRRGASGQQGFTYLGLLLAVVIIGLMLTVAAHVWQTTVQRQREAELLWVGHAYRTAIASYFALGHRYPATLQDLLVDERFPVPKHHLRKLYPDPMTGRADWTLVLTANQMGIQGVASRSQAIPIKRDGFDQSDFSFKGMDCYCLWTFVYSPYRWMPGGGTSVPPFGAPAPQTPGLITSPGGPTSAPGVPVPLPSNPSTAPLPPHAPVPGPH